jgi:hypothetical protein
VIVELLAALDNTVTLPVATGTLPEPKAPRLLEPAGEKISPGSTGFARQ